MAFRNGLRLHRDRWWLNSNDCTVQNCQMSCHRVINTLLILLVSLAKVSHPNEQEIAEQNLLITRDLHLALSKSHSHESVIFAIDGCKQEWWVWTLALDPKPTAEASNSNEKLQIGLGNPSSCVNLSLNWKWFQSSNETCQGLQILHKSMK